MANFIYRNQYLAEKRKEKTFREIMEGYASQNNPIRKDETITKKPRVRKRG